MFSPAPSQDSHRPPPRSADTLNENRDWYNPDLFGFGLIWRAVHGCGSKVRCRLPCWTRDFRPIRFWSMMRSLSMCSQPSTMHGIDRFVVRWTVLDCRAGTRLCCIKDDFPEPDTPVTTTKRCKGIRTLTPLRLLVWTCSIEGKSLQLDADFEGVLAQVHLDNTVHSWHSIWKIGSLVQLRQSLLHARQLPVRLQ